ncbi:hypothetical protein [Moorella sulfitireducens (nom. illeg.)]|uniref:hypothetical protein n=1 Tax=Neomoorella sulfitireducens TaxID=2972948 RepID=UPI0021AC0275|nr:hypothetical protein [Moorella sulfitireducens]
MNGEETPIEAGGSYSGEIILTGVSVRIIFTSFAIKTDNLLGQIRRTGIYVRENGIAGTVQQIDLRI